MNKEHFNHNVDGVNLSARHFAGKKKEDAIDAMIADNITSDRAWAGHAYDKLVKAVADKDAPPEKKEEVKAAEEVKPVSVLAELKGEDDTVKVMTSDNVVKNSDNVAKEPVKKP